jgi:hypothetical protein
MTRNLLLAAAGLLACTAGAASARTSQYRAELAAPAAAARLVVRDIVWNCTGAGCVAGQGNSRPIVDCAALARQAGAIRSFSVAGAALPAEAMEKCNAAAR